MLDDFPRFGEAFLKARSEVLRADELVAGRIDVGGHYGTLKYTPLEFQDCWDSHWVNCVSSFGNRLAVVLHHSPLDDLKRAEV